MYTQIYYYSKKNTLYTKEYKQKCHHSVAYENMLKPRLDDFIYNTLGQLLYFIMSSGYCVC
jgi:hypothetical protein